MGLTQRQKAPKAQRNLCSHLIQCSYFTHKENKEQRRARAGVCGISPRSCGSLKVEMGLELRNPEIPKLLLPLIIPSLPQHTLRLSGGFVKMNLQYSGIT
jgi:hypothetical protein